MISIKKLKPLMFLLFFTGITTAEKTQQELYPTIVFSIKVYDQESKEDLQNFTLIREIYYDYTTPSCQLNGGIMSMIEQHENILNLDDELVGKELKLRYQNSLPELKKKYQGYKRKEKISVKDTIVGNSPNFYTHPAPFKKYFVKIKHEGYETVNLSDSFNVCDYNIDLNVGLSKKQ